MRILKRAWVVLPMFLISVSAQMNPGASVVRNSELIISPSGPLVLESGSHRQFTANAIGSGGAEVSWKIEGEDCATRDCGSISNDGFYAAPGRVERPLHLRIVARETQAPFLNSSELVTIQTSKSQYHVVSCKSSEPGYCSLGWQIHQALFPFTW